MQDGHSTENDAMTVKQKRYSATVCSQLFIFQRVNAAAAGGGAGADIVVVGAVVAVCTLSLASFTSNEMLNFVFRFSFNHNFEQSPIGVHCKRPCLVGCDFRVLHCIYVVVSVHTQLSFHNSAKLSMQKYKFWLKSVPNAYHTIL